MMDADDFEHLWSEVQTLTKHRVTALHYLREKSGQIRCLNTDSVADSEPALDAAVAVQFDALGDEDALPCSPRDRWEAYGAFAPASMPFTVSKMSHWRRRAIIAGFHLEIVGNNE